MEIGLIKERFVQLFGNGPVRIFFGPARINLIGEHTDHQGGYVLPCAISLRSACAVRPRNDGKLQIAVSDLPGIVEADVSNLSGYAGNSLSAYQIGVAYVMQQRGFFVGGMDMLFDDTMPHGSGLSASAAIEVATATAIATLSAEKTGAKIDMTELALIAQEAENSFVGMNCGIMDQFASAMGKKDCAIFLRCADLTYRYVPVDLCKKGYTLMICNTRKPRSLVESAYNARRVECETAFTAMKAAAGISCLADLTPERFEKYRSLIDDPIAEKRACHVIYENDRTIRACGFLENGQLAEFGVLMNESHRSLREFFEVTGMELDAMVDASQQQKGVLGARMTGAGFGGCAIALVANNEVDSFTENVGRIYTRKTGYTPEFYKAQIGDGAREIRSSS